MQRVVRGRFGRKAVSVIKSNRKFNNFVIKLQSAVRMLLSMKKKKMLRRAKRCAYFQRFTKQLKCKEWKQTLVSIQHYLRSVICIQKATRMYLAKKRVKFKRFELKVILAQSVCRSRLARSRLVLLRYIRKVVKIQSSWRRYDFYLGTCLVFLCWVHTSN